MPVLHKKIRRDIRQSLGVLLTVIAIIAVGAGSFIALRSAQRILETSKFAYYRNYHFGDFWIDLKKAPLPAVEKIADLPGVARVEPRIVFDVILDLPHVTQPLTGRLVSAPTDGFEDTINGICLVRGSGFSDDREEEIIISEAFAQAHKLDPGDRIGLILNRKQQSFIIAGTAISPEYVYMVRGGGDITPDPEHFGVLYAKRAYVEEILDFKDACNQITGLLAPDFRGNTDELLDRMERILEPYGVFSAIPRSLQASNRFLSDEINGLAATAAILPTIFLLVAALVLNILMNRLAERQRTVIGTLKALGYSNRQVLVHFLTFGIAIGIVGGLAGIGVGISMASGMIELYKTFFQFPNFVFNVYPDLLLIGTSISLLFAVGGTAKGVWSVLKLHPAEAMRQKPPERGGAIFLEKIPYLWRRLSFRSHMALRSLFRHPPRTLTGVIASALSSAIIFLTLVMYDSTYFLVDFQFTHIAHSDADISMRDERNLQALLEARSLPGVDYAEPTLAVVCDLQHQWRSRRISIVGLSENHRLITPMQKNLDPIEIPDEGLVMSQKLAEILGVTVGDQLRLTPVRGRRNEIQVTLAGISDSYFGLDCYADQQYLSRLVGEAAAVNSVQLTVDKSKTDRLYRKIKTLPNAQGLTVRADALHNIEKTLTETLSSTLGISFLFAGIIAFGSMLNGSMIEIGDRLREISTFRVLGYSSSKISGIFLRQNLTIYVLGLILAFPLGYGLSLLSAQAYNTELFRMPIVVRPTSIIFTIILTLFFVLFAQFFVYRTIGRLDWLEGTKVKE